MRESYNHMLNRVNNPMLNYFVDNRGMTNKRGSDRKTTETIGNRIAQALEKSRFKTQGELAKKVGSTTQAVSYWTLGERLPGTQNCIDLAKELNISLDWLLLGKGSMRPENIKGEAVYIDGWPVDAKSVVKGMAALYEDQRDKAK